MDRATGKVLVIGLDGATFDLIKPWVSEGRLPVLGRLLETGVHATLLSTHQSNSAQAWSSFITGKNAGKHGIYDFISPVLGSYDVRFVSAALREGKSLWRLLSDAHKKVGVLNVPITYPPEEVDGFLHHGSDIDRAPVIFLRPGFHTPEVEQFLHQAMQTHALIRYHVEVLIPLDLVGHPIICYQFRELPDGSEGRAELV